MRETCWPLKSHIYDFIYFDDNNKIKNGLIILLVNNKL
jgi:hypothetical protein